MQTENEIEQVLTILGLRGLFVRTNGSPGREYRIELNFSWMKFVIYFNYHLLILLLLYYFFEILNAVYLVLIIIKNIEKNKKIKFKNKKYYNKKYYN